MITVLLIILAFLAGLLILRVFGAVLKLSVKVMWKLIVNAVCGAVILLLFNFFGGFFNLTIAITPLRALLTGVLGIPGVILLLLFC